MTVSEGVINPDMTRQKALAVNHGVTCSALLLAVLIAVERMASTGRANRSIELV